MIEGTLEVPIFGVSTLADNRKTKEGKLQVNFKSDKVKGLTSRPPAIFSKTIQAYDPNKKYKSIKFREGDIDCYAVLSGTIDKTGNCELYRVYPNLPTKTFTLSRALPTDYLYNTDIDDIELYYIEQQIYVLNKTKKVTMIDKKDENETTGDRFIPAVAVVNFLEALNYQEHIEVTIQVYDKVTNEGGVISAGITLGDASGTGTDEFIAAYTFTDSLGTHSVPAYIVNLPDEMRSTYGIVQAIQALMLNYIRTGTSTSDIFLKERVALSVSGSSLIVELRESVNGSIMKAKDARIEIQVSAGEGSTGYKVTNYETQDVDGLPLYTKVGHTLKVTPSKNKADSTYYVRAEKIEDNVETGNSWLGNNSSTHTYKVKWVQTRAPNVNYEINKATMPLVEKYGVNMESIDWGVRTTGDELTVQDPVFVNSTINGISYYQNRIVFISESYAQFSETDDPFTFFRSSAIQLLVTDAFYVSSSLIGTSKLLEVIPHNKDLLFFTKDKQLKITGEQPLTPELTSLRVSTSYSLKQSKVKPVSIGNAVYFVTDYGDSNGLFRYFAEENTGADRAEDLSSKVVGMIKGNPELMEVSPNLSMIVIKTDYSDNRVYVYQEMIGSEGERIDVWCEWVLGVGLKITDMLFVDEELTIDIYNENAINGTPSHYRVKMNMYNRLYNQEDIYLDNLETFSFSGAFLNDTGAFYGEVLEGVPIKTMYVSETIYNAIQEINSLILTSLDIEEKYQEVRVISCEKSFDKYVVTLDKPIIPLSDEIRLYIGNSMERRYIPNRPFLKDDYNRIVVSDDIRIIRYGVSIEETGYVKLLGVSEEYEETIEQEYNSYILNEFDLFENNPKLQSKVITFSFSMSASRSYFEIYSNKMYPLTISQITWEGNLTRRNQRV